MCNGLKMQWIDAHAVRASTFCEVAVLASAMAHMIKFESLWNRADHQLIRDPVRHLSATVKSHAAVSSTCPRPRPYPAIVRAEYHDVRPKLSELPVEVHEIKFTAGIRRHRK